MTPEVALDQGLEALGLHLPTDARTKLLAYLALMGKWNRTYNLTAIRDPLAMVTHHLLDSLATLPHLDGDNPALSLADVGSGAGLPGIPLALACPSWRVTLNDRSSKKAAFLRQAKLELALPNVDVHEGPVEDWQPRQRFDCVISRAFAALTAFVSSCRHLLAPGGVLAAMKGAWPEAASGEALPPDTCCTDVRRLHVPLLDADRHLVLCRIEEARA